MTAARSGLLLPALAGWVLAALLTLHPPAAPPVLAPAAVLAAGAAVVLARARGRRAARGDEAAARNRIDHAVERGGQGIFVAHGLTH